MDLIRADWPAPANVQAFVTTRKGGCSKEPWSSLNLGLNSGDDANRVTRNRQQLEQWVGAPLHWLQQEHGTRVVRHSGTAPINPRADAWIASEPRRVCTILTADCLPVFLCDRSGTQVALAHAGWRGLAAGVIQKTVAEFSVSAGSLIAWLGPAIGPEVYEVGADVKSAFGPEFQSALRAHRDRWFFDLPAAASMILRNLGVDRIFGGKLCTFSDSERFYSYRRDGQTGRMASLIWFTDPEDAGV